MRTRTSTRNQNILFKELFQPAPKPNVDTRSVESLTRQLAMVSNPRGRRQIEREIAAAKQRELIRAALAK